MGRLKWTLAALFSLVIAWLAGEFPWFGAVGGAAAMVFIVGAFTLVD